MSCGAKHSGNGQGKGCPPAMIVAHSRIVGPRAVGYTRDCAIQTESGVRYKSSDVFLTIGCYAAAIILRAVCKLEFLTTLPDNRTPNFKQRATSTQRCHKVPLLQV